MSFIIETFALKRLFEIMNALSCIKLNTEFAAVQYVGSHYLQAELKMLNYLNGCAVKTAGGEQHTILREEKCVFERMHVCVCTTRRECNAAALCEITGENRAAIVILKVLVAQWISTGSASGS